MAQVVTSSIPTETLFSTETATSEVRSRTTLTSLVRQTTQSTSTALVTIPATDPTEEDEVSTEVVVYESVL
jgi:hypothetical protein